VKELESENFIKDQTIRQLQEQSEVGGNILHIFYIANKKLSTQEMKPQGGCHYRNGLQFNLIISHLIGVSVATLH